MNSRIPKETKIAIIEDYVCGVSVIELREKYNLHRQSINNILGGYLGSNKLASLNTSNSYEHYKLIKSYEENNLTIVSRHPNLIYE